MFLLSLPCVFGFNLWSSFEPFGAGTGVLDLEDFIVSNILLPVGSFVFVLFCTSKWGWGWKNFIAEANEGKGSKIKPWMRGYMRYALPVLMFAFIVISLVTFFI